jgi:hypothetical protein
MEAGVTEQDLQQVFGRRIPFKDRLDLTAQIRKEHAHHPLRGMKKPSSLRDEGFFAVPLCLGSFAPLSVRANGRTRAEVLLFLPAGSGVHAISGAGRMLAANGTPLLPLTKDDRRLAPPLPHL